jgi:hypothetical protein
VWTAPQMMLFAAQSDPSIHQSVQMVAALVLAASLMTKMSTNFGHLKALFMDY